MRAPRTLYLLTFVYIIIGIYFLLFSNYPLFIILFIALSGYHYFLARAINKYKEEDKNISKLYEDAEKESEDGSTNER